MDVITFELGDVTVQLVNGEAFCKVAGRVEHGAHVAHVVGRNDGKRKAE